MKTLRTLMLDAAPAGLPLLAVATCLAVARATTRIFRNNSKTGVLLAGLLLGSVSPARASLEFNGSSSYTIINASFLNGITTPTFTFDFWMKPADVNTWSLVWSKAEFWKEWTFGGIQNGSFGFMQAWPNGYYTIESPTNVLKSGQWQHIVIVGNGTIGQFYVDGVAIPTTGSLYGQLSFNAQATGSARGPMVWGLRDNTTLPDDGWFGGKLAHFRVWDRALSAAEVAAFHNAPPSDTAQGLRHHLPLNETTGAIMHDVIGGLHGDTFDTTWSADGPPPPTLTDGLVAYYPLSGNVLDASGNGNDAVNLNTSYDVDRFGLPNNSLAFDGTNSQLSVVKTLLDLGQDYTISLWFKFNDASLIQQMLGCTRRDWGLAIDYNDAPSTPPRVINWAVGKGTVGWLAAYEHGDKNDYVSGQWYQMIFKKNQHDYTMFIDGKLESALTVTNDFSYSPPEWVFGCTGSAPGLPSAAYINGNLDDIRIYNRALSDADVGQLYQLEKSTNTLADGLVAYYPFNGNAADESGSGNSGVVLNATPAIDRFGVASRSLYFNGTNAYVEIVDAPSIHSTGLLTVSAWVKADSTQTGSPYGVNIVGKVGDSWSLSIVPTGELRPIAMVGIWSYFNCQTILQTGVWYQVAMVFNGSQLQGFVNGNLDGTMNLNGVVGSTTNPVRIGVYIQTNNPDTRMYFVGQIDDVRIYNRALSAQEVAELYASESAPNPCIPHGAKATATVVNGFVVGATITDGGCGYTNAPFVLITGDGTGATATATITDGVVTGINITGTGSGYGTNTVIKIASPPFMPSLGIAVSKVNVTLHLVLGRNYVLLSSTDLKSWNQVGAKFTAQDELVTLEFAVSETGRYFQIQEVP